MAPREVATVLKEFSQVKPPNFRPTTSHALERARQWRHYLIRFESVFEVLSLKDEDDATKVKLLTVHEYDIVHKASEAVADAQVAALSGVYKKLKGKLNIYYQTKTLEEYAKTRLSTIQQKDSQSASDLLVEIKELISDAGWNEASNRDDQIKSVLLRALKSEAVRQQYRFSTLPGKTEFTLDDIVEVANVIARSADANKQRLEHVVQAIRHYQPKGFRSNNRQNQSQNQRKYQNKPCFGCGSRKHPNNKDPRCPAKDVQCYGCSKKGHFQSQCRGGSNPKNRKPFNPKNKFNKKKQFYTKKVQGPSNTPGSEPPSVNSPGVDQPSNEPSDQYNAQANIGDSLANLLDQNVFFS